LFKNKIKYKALFFLSAFVLYLLAGGAIKGLKYYSSISPDWEVACKIKGRQGNFNQTNNWFSTEKENSADNAQDAKVINCNLSLQALSITSNFIFNPEQTDHIIQRKSSLLIMQIFVFQEPDPPKFG